MPGDVRVLGRPRVSVFTYLRGRFDTSRNSILDLLFGWRELVPALKRDLIKGHTLGGSVDDGVALDSVPLGKFSDHVLDPFNEDKPGAPLVSLLLLSGCPARVLWSVVSIVVDAIQRVTVRTRTHVRSKLMKVSDPFIANLYTPPAVVLVLAVVRIVAAPFHALPDRIKWMGILKRHCMFSLFCERAAYHKRLVTV